MSEKSFFYRLGVRIGAFFAIAGTYLKQEISKTRLVGWLWLLLALSSIIVLAHIFRYAILNVQWTYGKTFLFDRWEQQTCVVIDGHKIICPADGSDSYLWE